MAGSVGAAAVESEEYERGYGSGPQGMREVTLFCKGFTFNPVVSIGAAVMLWAFVIKVSVDQEGSMEDFGEWKTWVAKSFTWLYIGSQDYWLLFLVPLCYYYGHVKLGGDDEKPEYSDMSYFCMVFCAGVAIGLIFYGASEPLWHMLSGTGANRYNNNGYSNDNQKAQDAINVTLFHWGLQAWVVYALTAVSMGFLSYRKGLPLCFRTTLAPLFGKATWGWFGDIIDIVTIVTIVAGLCTSLGLGAKQIVAGLQRLEVLDSDLDEKGLTNAATFAIVIITGCATLSVVSGLNYGIKTLSQTAFVLGNFLLCTVFFLDAPWYLLNVMVQSLGYHFQHFIEIGFFTDAFAQLMPGEGQPNDGKGADPSWMDWWTIFYWGWWIAWAPFVGTFLARISRGRTIANVIAYSLTVPFFYALVWFCTFGAAGIRMHRRAEFLETNFGDQFLAANQDFRPAGAGKCFDVPGSLPAPHDATFSKYETNTYLSPVCLFSWKDDAGYWFDLMYQFYGMGPFLSGVSILVIVLFFVTSSDSGSLVVDLIAANGREAHVVQRIFWAVSEGAVAVALLQAGGSQSLKALQAISIVAGLPFTVILMFMCTALWRALKIDQGHMAPRASRVDWALPLYGGVFEIFETVLSRGRSGLPESGAVAGFALGIFAPPLLLYRSARGLAEKQAAGGGADRALPSSKVQDLFLVVASGLLYLAFWVLQILALARVNRGLSGMGWAALVAFVSIVAVVRHGIRLSYRIEGSGMEDFFVCLVFFPQALAQMAKQVTLEIQPAATLKAESPGNAKAEITL